MVVTTWRFFELGMQHALEIKETRSLALRYALHHDELTLHYLPQVDASGQWCGCEALVSMGGLGRGATAP